MAFLKENEAEWTLELSKKPKITQETFDEFLRPQFEAFIDQVQQSEAVSLKEATV